MTDKQLNQQYKLTAVLIQLLIEQLDLLVANSDLHNDVKAYGNPLLKKLESFQEGLYKEKEVSETNTLPKLTNIIEKTLVNNINKPKGIIKNKIQTTLRKNT